MENAIKKKKKITSCKAKTYQYLFSYSHESSWKTKAFPDPSAQHNITYALADTIFLKEAKTIFFFFFATSFRQDDEIEGERDQCIPADIPQRQEIFRYRDVCCNNGMTLTNNKAPVFDRLHV